ncbi:FAD-dependent oxidoreductase [Paenibacillus bouchesdurhonensis]|uniref:FAD-dependent oxidoreductase n=1 Tax=Paenibacillus bouchesdurhonensis TaxID=1870990 RepID=UPI000DA5F145|nr:FAD-dependent oxidoreductase [Paenibacillus bouchesdurhonensis]
MAEVIVIGAGPAGASAALFLAKAGKETLVLDSNTSMTKRAWIDNHYGTAGISGPDLLQIGREQAEKFGAKFIEEKVLAIDTNGGSKVAVKTESGRSFEASHIILATGVLTELASSIGLELKDGTEPRIKTVIQTDGAGRTSKPRIWAAGTAAGVSVHTIITAGDGAKVAIELISEMNGERYVDHDMMK